MTALQFIEHLSSFKSIDHDVQGVILKTENCLLYLRIENWNGSFLIELLIPNCPAREHILLRDMLPFKTVEGYMPTVIEWQLSYAFMYKDPV